MTAIYGPADKALAALSKAASMEFMRLAVMPIDEINVVGTYRVVNAIYERLLLNNRKAYLNIALSVYTAAMNGAHKSMPDDSWIDMHLGEYNPVTGYLYYNEADRKRMRTAEQVLTAAQFKSRSILNDTTRQAANVWWRQTSQYAIDITDAATLAAYRDSGVERVMWITEQDERVCKVCNARDGNVYLIDNIPPKTHYGCRCYLVPVK